MSTTEVLRPVTSSMFTAAGYDDSTFSLVLQFKSTGEVRAYRDVSPDIADEALSSKSLGQYFNQNIKGKFEHEIMPAEAKSQKEILPKVDGLLSARKSEPEFGLTDEELDMIYKAPAKDERAGHPVPVVETVIETQPSPTSPASDLDVQAAIDLPKQKAPQIDSIIDQGKKLSVEAMATKVTDAISYECAALTLKMLQDARDRAFKFLDPIREAVYRAYQVVQKRQKEALDPIDNAIATVKRAMSAYTMEQEHIRQAQLAEERRKAEEEAARLQREQSEQLTLAEVNDALEAGDTAKAEELMAHPVEAPLPYVAPAHVASVVPQVQGISTRKNWKVAADELDVQKFLQAVKDGKFEIKRAAQLVQFNVPALNKLAKALETAFDVPGARAYNDAVIGSRR